MKQQKRAKFSAYVRLQKGSKMGNAEQRVENQAWLKQISERRFIVKLLKKQKFHSF